MVMSVQKQARGVKFAKRAIKPSSLVLTLSAVSACGGSDDSSAQTGGDQTPTPTTSNSGDQSGGAPRSVNLIINHANDTNVSAGDIDELNIVFGVNASFDAKQLADGAVINLGLDAAGQKVASLGTVDFDDVNGPLTTLNVHSSAPHVEVDFAKDNIGTLVVNLQNGTNDIVIGAGEFVGGLRVPNFSMDFLDAKTVEVNHMTSGDVVVHGSIQLDHYTTDLTITSHEMGGVLDMALFAPRAAFEEGDALTNVSVHASGGDMRIATPLTVHREGDFIDDIENLQHYSVVGDNNATMFLGQLGFYGLGDDLETISVNLSDGASLGMSGTFAPYAKVSELSIVTSSPTENLNVLNDFATAFLQEQRIGSPDHNVLIRGTYFDELSHLHIETTAGGKVSLLDTSFTVHEQVFVGTGDIIIEGAFLIPIVDLSIIADLPDFKPLQQLQPADASDHTGNRTFIDGKGHDIFYGSTKDDTIIFALDEFFAGGPFAFPSVPVYAGEYRDSGGDDLIIIERIKQPILIIDGDADTNDRVESYGENFFTADQHRIDFRAGSGQDEIELMGSVAPPLVPPLFPPTFFFPVLNHDVKIDFADWISGHVHVIGFYGDSEYFTISLDGLPGITNTNLDYSMALDPATPTVIDENAIYLLDDGTSTTAGLIADYKDLTEVASVLDQMFVGTMQDEDSAVFILNNVNPASGESDYYFYLYNEADNGASIDAAELQHFATFDMYATSPLLTVTSFS